jgi:hypothetical protein
MALLLEKSKLCGAEDRTFSDADGKFRSGACVQTAVGKTKTSMQAFVKLVLLTRQLILILLIPFTGVAAFAADTPKSVFVKESCLDTISSDVLSSLEKEIRKSQKYRWARNLGDGNQTGVVFTINVSCTQRKNVVAIATVFGAAKCFSATNCHHAVDGSTIRADSCDATTAADCGQALFKAFDDYMSSPIRSPLRLN